MTAWSRSSPIDKAAGKTNFLKQKRKREASMDKQLETSTINRIYWRIIPLFFAMMFFNYLDRINIGFAGLRMNHDLGFGPAIFGFGASIFFLGYMVLEIPSNLMLHLVGARVWLARILITWGAVATAMAFVSGDWSFYLSLI